MPRSPHTRAIFLPVLPGHDRARRDGRVHEEDHAGPIGHRVVEALQVQGPPPPGGDERDEPGHAPRDADAVEHPGVGGVGDDDLVAGFDERQQGVQQALRATGRDDGPGWPGRTGRRSAGRHGPPPPRATRRVRGRGGSCWRRRGPRRPAWPPRHMRAGVCPCRGFRAGGHPDPRRPPAPHGRWRNPRRFRAGATEGPGGPSSPGAPGPRVRVRCHRRARRSRSHGGCGGSVSRRSMAAASTNISARHTKAITSSTVEAVPTVGRKVARAIQLAEQDQWPPVFDRQRDFRGRARAPGQRDDDVRREHVDVIP